eukprot:387047-Pelagomonas_calceolata.AAC.1
MNVPVMRKDLRRINVCKSNWDRAHKDSIRATLVSGRGAMAWRSQPVPLGKTQSGIVRDKFSGT